MIRTSLGTLCFNKNFIQVNIFSSQYLVYCFLLRSALHRRWAYTGTISSITRACGTITTCTIASGIIPTFLTWASPTRGGFCTSCLMPFEQFLRPCTYKPVTPLASRIRLLELPQHAPREAYPNVDTPSPSAFFKCLCRSAESFFKSSCSSLTPTCSHLTARAHFPHSL